MLILASCSLDEYSYIMRPMFKNIVRLSKLSFSWHVSYRVHDPTNHQRITNSQTHGSII